ncbi:MAG: hypothetical protein V5A77_05095 [Candidatus Bipolaricaulota bacterium]|nr:hypothetical protein [Candidatus Bipolaricaulota bacterium]
MVAINDSWRDITGYEEEEISTISDWTKRAYGKARNNVTEHIEKLYEFEERVDQGIRNPDKGKRDEDLGFQLCPV